jgi:hypothetical protein
MSEPEASPFGDFTEQDLKTTLNHALRWLAILAVVGAVVTWAAAGWQSGALFLIGAAVAGAGLHESKRLMLAVLSRFNQGGQGKPVAGVLVWFFLRLIVAGVVLYVSLRSLDGSVYALCAGLGLAVVALTIESIRLLRAWTL